MKTTVNKKLYNGEVIDQDYDDSEYQCYLKRAVFMKFFSILKLGGKGLINITDGELLELEFCCEKYQAITV